MSEKAKRKIKGAKTGKRKLRTRRVIGLLLTAFLVFKTCPYVASEVKDFINEKSSVTYQTDKNMKKKQTDKSFLDIVKPSTFKKAIAITSSFEGRGYTTVAGDFDNQGISIGMLQWNIGQGTLQPLLKEMVDKHPQIARKVFGANFNQLVSMIESSHDKQLMWAKSINDRNNNIKSGWKKHFARLTRTKEFRAIQDKALHPYGKKAYKLCKEKGIKSERGYVLMFDVVTQNGGFDKDILLIDKVNKGIKFDEKQKLVLISQEAASSAREKYQEDVRDRKLAIVNGSGYVHGKNVNLDQDYGLSDEPFYEVAVKNKDKENDNFLGEALKNFALQIELEKKEDMAIEGIQQGSGMIIKKLVENFER